MVKSFLLFLFSFVLLTSCESEERQNRNTNLLEINVNIQVSLNLPQFNQLNFPGNAMYVSSQGNLGVIVVNTGSGFLAWDAADPNILPQDCSRLEINGLEAESNCDSQNVYSLVTGQPLSGENLKYPLYAYRINQGGDVLNIFN
jgi:hypothetical protein